MKLRLLISLLILSTIAVGVIAYFINTKGKDYFISKMKEEIIAEAKTEIGNAFRVVKNTEETRYFAAETEKFFNEIKSKPFTFESKTFEKFIDSLRQYGSDGVLSTQENAALMPMLKKSFVINKSDGININID